MQIQIKISGITSIEAIRAAVVNQVDFIDCIFYPRSPRGVKLEFATDITASLPSHIKKVAVIANPTDKELKNIIKEFKPQYLQLDENTLPDRIIKIKKKFSIPIIQTISLRNIDDQNKIHAYEETADMFLFGDDFDNLGVKTPHHTFDPGILKRMEISKPWILSGSLDRYNVNHAIRVSGATIINASSSLEISPGIKSSTLIEKFVSSVRNSNY